MTAVFTLVLAAIGLAIGPVLADVARRALDEDRPPLLQAGDLRVSARLGGANRARRDRIIQVSTAILFAAVTLVVGTRWVLPGYLWFVAVTVVLTTTDVDRKLIPNRITLPGAAGGAVLLAVGALLDGDPERLWWALLGGVGYMVVMFVLAMIVPGGLGIGDVKLAPILGAFVAAERLSFVVVAFLSAYVVGGVVSGFLLITKIKGRKDTIPFGPYMVLGAYVALFAGAFIIDDWYLG